MAIDSKYGKLNIPPIGDDEPVFILRARDPFAIGVIRHYLEAVRDVTEVSLETAVYEVINRFAAFKPKRLPT